MTDKLREWSIRSICSFALLVSPEEQKQKHLPSLTFLKPSQPQSVVPFPIPPGSRSAPNPLLFFLQQSFYNRRKQMQQVGNQDEPLCIVIKRPFLPKFIKQLNYQQQQKIKKTKRRLKTLPQSPQKAEILEKAGAVRQSSKRLCEVNRNGNRILANWKNDQINGEAEIYYHNGVTFKGVYQNGVKVKGHFKFLNGYQYVGHCLGNKFYGEGSLIFPSGKIISGEWKEYNVIGNGKMEYPHGEVYYGEIVDFKKHGKGYLFLADGSKYVGEFANGLISGNGTYFVDDLPVSKGLWQKGELVKAVDMDEINEESIELNEADFLANEIEKEVKLKKSGRKASGSIQTEHSGDESDASARRKRVHFRE